MTPEYNSTLTLNMIRAYNPCRDGYSKLLVYLGKTKADDDPLTILTVLNSNGFDDALWCLRALPDDRLSHHFQAWCAEQVLYLFESEFPDDNRVRDQITMLRNDDATPEERAAAWDAAKSAARAAAKSAEKSAARDARDAAISAAWAAAKSAARAAWDARAAAKSAARAAAKSAARAAAKSAQERQLRIMLEAMK